MKQTPITTKQPRSIISGVSQVCGLSASATVITGGRTTKHAANCRNFTNRKWVNRPLCSVIAATNRSKETVENCSEEKTAYKHCRWSLPETKRFQPTAHEMTATLPTSKLRVYLRPSHAHERVEYLWAPHVIPTGSAKPSPKPTISVGIKTYTKHVHHDHHKGI